MTPILARGGKGRGDLSSLARRCDGQSRARLVLGVDLVMLGQEVGDLRF